MEEPEMSGSKTAMAPTWASWSDRMAKAWLMGVVEGDWSQELGVGCAGRPVVWRVEMRRKAEAMTMSRVTRSPGKRTPLEPRMKTAMWWRVEEGL